MKMRLHALGILIATILVGCASSSSVRTVVVVGSATRSEDEGEAPGHEAIDWAMGRSGPFQTETDFPLVVGNAMGVTFFLDGELGKTDKVDLVFEHPHLSAPQGRFPDRTALTKAVQAKRNDHYVEFIFRLNENWQLVPGDWTVEISQQGHVIGRAIFKAYFPAGAGPAPAG